MTAEPVLVLFCGGLGGSAIEELMAGALVECALDSLDEALATGAYAGAIVVADADAARRLGGRMPANARLDLDPPGVDFHLGRRFADVIARYELHRPVYAGCGIPLVKADELAAVAAALSASESAVVSNNFFSADLVGLVPGAVTRDIELPANDRIWPRLLAHEGGLANHALPRTIANQFDIDTPNDLAVLAYAGGAGPRLSTWLAAGAVETASIAAAARCFADRDSVVLVAGRISTDVLAYLQTETASQTRLYCEERGLQALGRDLSGEARTLLGFHLEAVGLTRFFEELAQMCDAVFLDTRPLFAHRGLQPSRSDRFLSDALQLDGIKDAWLRDFTAAAREAPVPVVLGGQSLVTSGLQLLSEAAWRENDRLDPSYKPKGRAARSS